LGCDKLVAFLVAQKKANPELLNYHEVIRGQSYQKLRFDIDASIEFIENVMADIKKPELEAKPAKPEATDLDFIDSLEFGLYEEKLAQVRRYNDYVTKTSLNEICCALLMNHIKVAIGAAFSKLYFSKGVPVSPVNVENPLVFDLSDETKFSRHIIIPGVHVENHMEAKAFADEMLKYLDEKLHPVVDLGVYKSLQNFRLFNNKKVSSPRVKVYKSGTFKAFSDSLIRSITEGSLKLPSILGQPTTTAPKIESELTKENVQAIVKLVNESALGNSLKKVMGNMLIFTRKEAGYCPICKRDHVNDNTHFVIVHDQAVWLHCRHSETHCGKKTTLLLGHLDVTRANGLKRAMSITANEIPEAFEKQDIKSRAMTPLNFDKAEGADMAPDTLLIKSPMGTGKTKALVEYLNRDQVPKDARVIIISFCKSFTSELLNNIGSDFVDYQTVDRIINHDKVIVQYKSLCQLNIHNLDKTILILDESESILTQTEPLQTTERENVFERWINFDNLIKHLAKVIAMNADAGFRTYDLLASSRKHVQMINNLWKPSPNEAPIDMYYDQLEAFLAAIVAAATKAKTEPFCSREYLEDPGQGHP